MTSSTSKPQINCVLIWICSQFVWLVPLHGLPQGWNDVDEDDAWGWVDVLGDCV